MSPPSIAPLHQYGRLRTADVNMAEQVVSEVFEPHRLLPSKYSQLNAQLNAVQVGSATLGYLAYGTEAQIDLPASDRWYHINVPLKGSSKAYRDDGTSASTKAGSSGAILVPHRAQKVEWKSETAQFALKIPRDDLERHLAQLAQQPSGQPLDLDLELDLSGTAGAGLLRAVHFVASEWDEDGALVRHSHSRRQLESLVLTNLLMAASGPHQRLLSKSSKNKSHNTLGMVVEYIHDNAQELLTVADLTQYAGVSSRTLQIAFRREYNCTPLEFIRDIRLAGVKDSLMNPQSASTTVSDVAMTWGFFNLGRFSGIYRSRYGENPSETLRRAMQ